MSADAADMRKFAVRWRIAAAVLIGLTEILALALGRSPIWLALLYAVMGFVSFVFYWHDKRAAQAGEWCVSEARLHGIDLFGGIAGGLLAQVLLRHKIAKSAFGTISGVIALVHLLALWALLLGVFSLPGGR